MSKIYFSLIASLLLISISCSQNAKENNLNDAPIAELLQRNEKIQHDLEWQGVQENYQKYNLALQNNNNDYISALSLIELYTTEARIGGEHGHYYPAALKLSDYILSKPDIDQDEKFYALTLKASVLLSQHEFNTALETAKKAIKLSPHNAQIHGVLVDCYVELGQYQEAIKAADAMIAIRPDLRSYARISYLREIHGDNQGAVEAMKMAVKSGMPGTEETAWATLELANLLQRTGNQEYTVLVLENLLKERKDYPFALAALAEIHLNNGSPERAKELLDLAISSIPEVGFYFTLAEYHKKENNNLLFNKTISKIEAMLEDDVKAGHNMDLEYTDLYLNLLNNPKKALLYASKVYQERPNNIDINRELAKIHKALSNPNKTSFHLSKAKRTNSKHPDLTALLKSPNSTSTNI